MAVKGKDSKRNRVFLLNITHTRGRDLEYQCFYLQAEKEWSTRRIFLMEAKKNAAISNLLKWHIFKFNMHYLLDLHQFLNKCIWGLFILQGRVEMIINGSNNLKRYLQNSSVATGSEFPVPGRFRVLQSRVRAGYGYTLKFETRVPGTLRVIGG